MAFASGATDLVETPTDGTTNVFIRDLEAGGTFLVTATQDPLADTAGGEKLAPMESWASIALAKDWYPPSRVQNTPSWHYVHSDQWRYEKDFTDYHTVPKNGARDTTAKGHTMDMQVRAVPRTATTNGCVRCRAVSSCYG